MSDGAECYGERQSQTRGSGAGWGGTDVRQGPVCLKGPVVTPTFLHPIQIQTPGLALVTC